MSSIVFFFFGGNSLQRKWDPMNSWYAADADATVFWILESPFSVLHSASRQSLSKYLGPHDFPRPALAVFPRFSTQLPLPLQSTAGWLQSTHLFLFFFLLGETLLLLLLLIPCYCCKLFMHFEVYLKHEQQHRNSLHGISNAVRDSCSYYNSHSSTSASVDLCSAPAFARCCLLILWTVFLASLALGWVPSGHIWSP